MSCGDCETTSTTSTSTAAAEESGDTVEFVESLSHFQLRETELDAPATGELAERCLAQFDDETASLDCRAIALYAVVAQLTSGNELMRAHVADVARRLQTDAVLTQPTAGAAGAPDFHRELINAVGVVLEVAPEKLVNASFAPVIKYLVRQVVVVFV